MLAYLSSWLYQPEAKESADPKESVAVVGFARYATAAAPNPPSSFVSELASVRLRHIETPPRQTYFPPRDPVLRQLLARRPRIA
jgi:hypothetical protein